MSDEFVVPNDREKWCSWIGFCCGRRNWEDGDRDSLYVKLCIGWKCVWTKWKVFLFHGIEDCVFSHHEIEETKNQKVTFRTLAEILPIGIYEKR
jgi:hypothetical protein